MNFTTEVFRLIISDLTWNRYLKMETCFHVSTRHCPVEVDFTLVHVSLVVVTGAASHLRATEGTSRCFWRRTAGGRWRQPLLRHCGEVQHEVRLYQPASGCAIHSRSPEGCGGKRDGCGDCLEDENDQFHVMTLHFVVRDCCLLEPWWSIVSLHLNYGASLN